MPTRRERSGWSEQMPGPTARTWAGTIWERTAGAPPWVPILERRERARTEGLARAGRYSASEGAAERTREAAAARQIRKPLAVARWTVTRRRIARRRRKAAEVECSGGGHFQPRGRSIGALAPRGRLATPASPRAKQARSAQRVPLQALLAARLNEYAVAGQSGRPSAIPCLASHSQGYMVPTSRGTMPARFNLKIHVHRTTCRATPSPHFSGTLLSLSRREPRAAEDAFRRGANPSPPREPRGPRPPLHSCEEPPCMRRGWPPSCGRRLPAPPAPPEAHPRERARRRTLP